MGLLIDALHSVEFLRDAPEEASVALMVAGRCSDFPKGHSFWRAGQPPHGIVVPITGEIKTASHSPEGREFIDRFIGPGECLGLESSLDGLPHPTNADVVRAGTFFAIARQPFLDYLAKRPELEAGIRRQLGRLYRQSLRDREDVALRPVPERVALFLLEHSCVRQGPGAKVLVHATQAEIAGRLGTVREVVARVFADFADRGLIQRTDKGIFVNDWRGLHDVAGIELPTGSPNEVNPATGTNPKMRTARFFLPRSEEWRRRFEPDSTGCREHLGGDISRCLECGCPVAQEERKKG
jgi:CRP-like cAMP-binding protein